MKKNSLLKKLDSHQVPNFYVAGKIEEAYEQSGARLLYIARTLNLTIGEWMCSLTCWGRALLWNHRQVSLCVDMLSPKNKPYMILSSSSNLDCDIRNNEALDAETLQLQLLLLVIRGRFRRGRRHHPREAKCFTARLKLHLSHLSLRVPRRLGFGQFINDKGVDIGHIRDCNSLGLGGLGFLHDLLGQDDNTFVLVWWTEVQVTLSR